MERTLSVTNRWQAQRHIATICETASMTRGNCYLVLLHSCIITNVYEDKLLVLVIILGNISVCSRIIERWQPVHSDAYEKGSNAVHMRRAACAKLADAH